MYLNILSVFFLIIIYNFVQYLQAATDLYIVKVKQIKCSDIDPEHILNVTCYVKAERNRHGIINLYWEELNMDQQIVHIQLLIQNSAGRFLPYFLDFQYNFCEWSQLMKSGPTIIQYIWRIRQLDMDHAKTDEAVTCPFNVRRVTYDFICVKNSFIRAIIDDIQSNGLWVEQICVKVYATNDAGKLGQFAHNFSHMVNVFGVI